MAQEQRPDEIPNAAWLSRVVQGLVRLGYRGTDLADIIAPGRTRAQMCDDLIARQRQARKAQL